MLVVDIIDLYFQVIYLSKIDLTKAQIYLCLINTNRLKKISICQLLGFVIRLPISTITQFYAGVTKFKYMFSSKIRSYNYICTGVLIFSHVLPANHFNGLSFFTDFFRVRNLSTRPNISHLPSAHLRVFRSID